MVVRKKGDLDDAITIETWTVTEQGGLDQSPGSRIH